MFDLNLMPIHIHQGQPLSQVSGLYAAGPPRRAARSRSEDLLILSLTTRGNDRISPEVQQSWLENFAQNFYKISGSVTSALRILIETLNLTMMENNLKSAQDGGAMTGAINLAAIHRRNLYIVQSGLTHAYTLTHQGLQHFYDASQSDRGLGLSRTPTIRYYQADLGTGGYFFMTDTPPETWSEDLLIPGDFPNLDQLRRRLHNQIPSNFKMGLVQITPGEGHVNIIQPDVLPIRSNEQVSPVTESPEPMDDLISGEVSVQEDRGDTQEVRGQSTTSESAETKKESETRSEVEPSPVPGTTDIPVETNPPPNLHENATASRTSAGVRAVSEHASEDVQPLKETGQIKKETFNQQMDRAREKGLEGLAAFFDWWGNARKTVETFFKDLIGRRSPAGSESSPKISQSTLLFIAVGVPLVVVAIAVGVYLFRGRTLQYQYYYELAEVASSNALAAEEPLIARTGWTQTLDYLDMAESFRQTDEIAALRGEAQIALDVLDGAVRLTYHPAIIGSLYSEINITRIISYGQDLYLFDATGGRVIHATRASQGYEVDPEFVCAAGNYSGGGVDALVDMVSLPINNPYQAHILAVDAVGNVAYCGPGLDPVVQSLPTPDGNQGEIARMTYSSNFLYVLSPSAGTIYVYQPTNGQFLTSPYDYFEGAANGEKPDLTQIVDLAVNGPDLYLLRGDGMLVGCVSSGLPSNPVICENPVSYVDGRPGKEDQAVVVPESNYVSVLYTAPPDPSISILDAVNADIYRFSLRFRLHQRLRPDMGAYELDSMTATAFTIGIDRIAFLAYGHQVFYAYVE